VTSAYYVPDLRRSRKFSPAFSTPCDEVAGRGRPVTGVALVPILPGFLQQRRTLAPIGRAMTSAGLAPLPPAFVPDVCADARAHRLGSWSAPPLADASLASRVVAVDTLYCKSFESSLRAALARTSYGTRSSAGVHASKAHGSSADAGNSTAPPPASPTTMRWISSPPQGGSQIGRRQSAKTRAPKTARKNPI